MSKEPMKQIDLIEELEKANQETITINKEDLETLIDALDASYKIFEASEELNLPETVLCAFQIPPYI